MLESSVDATVALRTGSNTVRQFQDSFFLLRNASWIQSIAEISTRRRSTLFRICLRWKKRIFYSVQMMRFLMLQQKTNNAIEKRIDTIIILQHLLKIQFSQYLLSLKKKNPYISLLTEDGSQYNLDNSRLPNSAPVCRLWHYAKATYNYIYKTRQSKRRS